MEDIVIHIGPHKSGTSALQSFFHINQQFLSEQNLVYPLFGNTWNNHHPIVDCFKTRSGIDECKQFIAEQIAEHAGQKSLLFSSEMFCEYGFDCQEFWELFDGLSVKIIAYIRNPCDQLVSAYNQVVRADKTRWTTPIGQKPWPYDVSFKDIFGAWLEHAGFTLCPYDPKQWVQGNIFCDFLSVLGLSAEGAKMPEDWKNISISPALIEIVRAANLAGLDEKTRSKIIDLLKDGESASTSYPLSVDACQECLEQLRAQMPIYRDKFRANMSEDYLFVNRAAAARLDAG